MVTDELTIAIIKRLQYLERQMLRRIELVSDPDERAAQRAQCEPIFAENRAIEARVARGEILRFKPEMLP